MIAFSRPILAAAMLVLATGLAPGAMAQDTNAFGALGAQSGEPVKVTADSFEVNEAQRLAVFSGKAVVTQAGFRLTAPTIKVHYGPGGASEIDSLEATGGVRMTLRDQTATGDSAQYDPKTRILRLSGNVVVTGKGGTVKGPQLVVDLAKGTSRFTATGGGRVTGVFTPSN